MPDASFTPPPHRSTWHEDLWGSPWRALLTVCLAIALAWGGAHLWDWAVWQALWRPDEQACRALEGRGACWGVVSEKFRVLLFGRYPFESHARPALCTLVLLTLAALTAWPRMWRAPRLAALWACALGLSAVLMGGGLFGLAPVPTTRWGGLPLTLGLTACTLALAFPLGLALALGRRAPWPAVQALCVTFIELVRGVPLISILFMASFLLPMVLPVGWSLDVLFRVLLGLSCFTAAYLAEVIRGGLQAIPAGQVLAARALGLTPWQVQRMVVLPQALAAVVPALTNNAIGVLKDTSLITVVGLFELSGALSLALGGDPNWRPFYLEGYLFIALIYGLLCWTLGRYSHWIESRQPRR